MARHVEVTYLDDIDGTAGANNMSFSLDGVFYEIDLADHNAERLRAALAEFIDKATKVGARTAATRRAARGTAKTGEPSRSAKIRAWAIEHGHEVSDRGRIPTSLAEAYDAAQQGS